MKWTRSPTPWVDHYQILKKHKKIASISATAPRVYRINLYSKYLLEKKVPKKWIRHLQREYKIRAVVNGLVSHSTPLKIKSVVDVSALPSPTSIVKGGGVFE